MLGQRREGWPYTALVSGEPLFPPGTGSNGLVASPLAYVGLLTGQEQFIRVAATAWARWPEAARAGTANRSPSR